MILQEVDNLINQQQAVVPVQPQPQSATQNKQKPPWFTPFVAGMMASVLARAVMKGAINKKDIPMKLSPPTTGPSPWI